jgi:hypothetical protein
VNASYELRHVFFLFRSLFNSIVSNSEYSLLVDWMIVSNELERMWKKGDEQPQSV